MAIVTTKKNSTIVVATIVSSGKMTLVAILTSSCVVHCCVDVVGYDYKDMSRAHPILLFREEVSFPNSVSTLHVL